MEIPGPLACERRRELAYEKTFFWYPSSHRAGNVASACRGAVSACK